MAMATATILDSETVRIGAMSLCVILSQRPQGYAVTLNVDYVKRNGSRWQVTDTVERFANSDDARKEYNTQVLRLRGMRDDIGE